MIEVTLNQPEFEYDIHSLIKAFYPSEYVGVSAEKKEKIKSHIIHFLFINANQ